MDLTVDLDAHGATLSYAESHHVIGVHFHLEVTSRYSFLSFPAFNDVPCLLVRPGTRIIISAMVNS